MEVSKNNKKGLEKERVRQQRMKATECGRKKYCMA